MIGFKKYLIEAKTGKNLHLEHLEDAVINDGSAGAIESIAFAEAIVDMLSGKSKSKHSITVKWDGAPAIICGINPENNKFFVGTKSVFNVTPKINYTNADIDNNHSGGLADKLKIALASLKKLNIKTILQGDMMYSSGDLKSETIEGKSYVTFTPNTITYAVNSESDLAKKILGSKMGIVFHTEYKGTDMASMNASFSPDTSSLTQTKDVWFDDAGLKDTSGVATFTEKESASIRLQIKQVKSMLNKRNMSVIDNLLGEPDMAILIKTFYNTLVRAGNIGEPDNIYRGFIEFVEKRYDAELESLKTERGKKLKQAKKDQVLKWLRTNAQPLVRVFAIQSAVRKIKLIIVNKISEVKSIGMFLRTDTGFKVTSPEGFVAVDRLSNTAYKLVDRLTFSQANFNAAKNWETG